jgi:hypothetical protein
MVLMIAELVKDAFDGTGQAVPPSVGGPMIHTLLTSRRFLDSLN